MQEYTVVVDVQFKVILLGRSKIAASSIALSLTKELHRELSQVGHVAGFNPSILSIEEVK